MANHGKCTNCWWWRLIPITLFWTEQQGLCYMQNGENGPGVATSENCYCPDYINRKKEEKKNGTLSAWLIKNDLILNTKK